MRQVHSQTFRGHSYRIRNVKNGIPFCHSPKIYAKEMHVPIAGNTRAALDTIIHESLHACLWDLDEEAVTETATDIMRFLWRLGWRNILTDPRPKDDA